MRFARYVYAFAGLSGIGILISLTFSEGWIAVHTPPAITHPEFFYGFISTAFACQILFLLIARDPVRYRTMMIPAMFEKYGYVAAIATLYLMGRISTFTASEALLDLILGVLFLLAYRRTRPAQA